MIALSLFFSAFLAATILPFSSEIALFTAVEGGLDKHTALLAASAGNILAVILNYYLGYFLYEKTKDKLLKSKSGKKAYHVGHNYGYYALLLSWLPIIGDPLTLVAGMVRLNFFYFLVIAASLRVARYVAVLYFS
ncbi:VTT domain-containing protein [Sulfurimonas sp. HSL-1716]|uniref:YqaA family protein n=1 Tax=Hydrocurvibacter sulfurireducens TaxID=3131937 RepID=UPI0031F89FEA